MVLWARPFERALGYSFNAAVLKVPFSLPMAGDVVALGDIHRRIDVMKDGARSTKKPVGFTEVAPQSFCRMILRRVSGSLRSRATMGNLKIEALSRAFGGAGCSTNMWPP